MRALGRGILHVAVASAAALWSQAALAADQPTYAPTEAWVKPVPIPQGGAVADGAPAQVLLYEVQAKFGDQGDEYFVDRVSKILTPEGLPIVGALSKTWDPDTEDLVIHHVHVIRGDTVIDALAGDQKLLVLRRENKLELAVLDGRLTATIEPEGLQVGDVVDFSYTVKRHDPALKGFSEDIERLVHTGVAKQIYWRESWRPNKPIRWRLTEGVGAPTISKTGDGTDVTFDLRDVETPKPPQNAPGRFFDLGSAEFSQYANWAQLSALLWPLYDKAATLPPGSPLRAEVAKIAGASADPKVRAAAALNLVEEQIRYVFLGMDDGGLVPANADATWARRYGDCKGKTALLIALLRNLGVTADPVLVSTTFGDGMDERLPAASWFDHVLVRARIAGKDYWLDGTRIGDRNRDRLTVPPYHWGLPLNATGAELVKLTPAPLAEPGIETDYRIDASKGPDAPAPTHVEVRFRGEEAIKLRLNMASMPRADYERSIREYWTKADPWFDVQTVSETDDPVTGLPRLSADGEGALDWSSGADGARLYRVPHSAMGADVSFKRQPGPHQDAPYAINFPHFSETSWRVVLPADGAFILVGSDVDKKVWGQELRRTSKIENGVLTVDLSDRSVDQEVPASEADAAGATLRELARTGVAVSYRFGQAHKSAAAGPDLERDRQAAMSGDAAAQYRLGKRYANGDGVPFDATQVVDWFSKSAAQGYAQAQGELGSLYTSGAVGVPKDYAKAAEWLNKGAAQNDAVAEGSLGLLYLRGWGVEQDDSHALKLLLQSASQRNPASEYYVGLMYFAGRGVAKDESAAAGWMQKAADQGLAAAQCELSLDYGLGRGVAKDAAHSVAWARMAAEQGSADGEALLGFAYQSGGGVAQDYAQALLWYQKAAEAGNAHAALQIAFMYANGLGVPKDMAQSLQWVRKTAESGSADAELELGRLYAVGQGVPQDASQSIAWIRKAADQGDARGQRMMGFAYLNGQGVQLDKLEAANWFGKAAAQGDGVSRQQLSALQSGAQFKPSPLLISPASTPRF